MCVGIPANKRENLTVSSTYKINGDFNVNSKRILLSSATIVLFFAVWACSGDVNNLSDYYGFGEIEIIKSDWGIQNLIVVDFNGDGLKDIAFANNHKTKIEILLQKAKGPDIKLQTKPLVDEDDINRLPEDSLFEKNSVAVSQKILSMVSGDFNSDGMVDIAFYGKPNGLYLILQKKDESQKKSNALSWRSRKKIKISDGLMSSNALVKSDFNNDGRDDIALASQKSIYIILQKDDGTLAEEVEYPTSAVTLGVDSSDLNGDGLNDLVLITDDRDKPLHVRFGLADGQLGPEMRFFIESPYVMEMWDIDGETGSEILTIDRRSGRLISYSLSTEMRADEDWPMLFYPFASSKDNRKRDIAVADFDGDGLDDIVVSDPAAAELIFYRQKAGIGLADTVRFPCFSDVDRIDESDIDGDGKSELIVLSVKEKLIGLVSYENSRLTFPKPLAVAGEPVAMEVADIDGDGEVDCVYISKDANSLRSLDVIYNLAAINKLKSKTLDDELLQLVKDINSCETGLELKKLEANPDGIKVIDVDQDGLNDIVVFVKYEKPILIRQIEQKKFEIADAGKTQASLIQQATMSSMTVGDIDSNKGKEILIAQDNFARSLKFSEQSKWQIIDQYNAKSKENKIGTVAAFNMSSDNAKPSILLLDGQKGQLQILNAGQDQTYRITKELEVGNWSNSLHLKMLFASVTGKDVNSIILFDSNKFALINMPEDDSGLSCEQIFSYETKIKDGIYGNMTSGDINNDGEVDIVMVDYKENHIEILTFEEKNKPVSAMSFKIFEEKSYRKQQQDKVGVEPREMKIADVTGDGKNDLVCIIHDRIIIYPQD